MVGLYTLYTFMFFLGIAGYLRHQTKSYRKALKEQARTRELLEKKVEEKTADLKKANAALELLSHTDGLTALHNRRYFDLQLEKEWKRLYRKDSVLADKALYKSKDGGRDQISVNKEV